MDRRTIQIAISRIHFVRPLWAIFTLGTITIWSWGSIEVLVVENSDGDHSAYIQVKYSINTTSHGFYAEVKSSPLFVTWWNYTLRHWFRYRSRSRRWRELREHNVGIASTRKRIQMESENESIQKKETKKSKSWVMVGRNWIFLHISNQNDSIRKTKHFFYIPWE